MWRLLVMVGRQIRDYIGRHGEGIGALFIVTSAIIIGVVAAAHICHWLHPSWYVH